MFCSVRVIRVDRGEDDNLVEKEKKNDLPSPPPPSSWSLSDDEDDEDGAILDMISGIQDIEVDEGLIVGGKGKKRKGDVGWLLEEEKVSKGRKETDEDVARLLEEYLKEEDEEEVKDLMIDMGKQEEEEGEEEEEEMSSFDDLLISHPQAVVIYHYGSSPLLPSHSPPFTVPPCPHCGSDREFELQLLPSLIPCLGVEMDWDSVLVFVCPNNCSHPTDDRDDLGNSLQNEVGIVIPSLLQQEGVRGEVVCLRNGSQDQLTLNQDVILNES